MKSSVSDAFRALKSKACQVVREKTRQGWRHVRAPAYNAANGFLTVLSGFATYIVADGLGPTGGDSVIVPSILVVGAAVGAHHGIKKYQNRHEEPVDMAARMLNPPVPWFKSPMFLSGAIVGAAMVAKVAHGAEDVPVASVTPQQVEVRADCFPPRNDAAPYRRRDVAVSLPSGLARG